MKDLLSPLDQRAEKVRKIVFSHNKNGTEKLSVFKTDEISKTKLEGESSADHSSLKSTILCDMESNIRELNSMRNGVHAKYGMIDIDGADFFKNKYGFSNLDELCRIGLGLDPSRTSVMQLQSSPDFNMGYKWLMSELILKAVKTGIRKPPIYRSMVAHTATISGMDAKIPIVNMADATPTVIGEADTIPTGSFKFGQKSVSSFKVGTGIKVTDEAVKYVNLDIMGAYFMDMPSKIDAAFDYLAISTVLMGNNPDGSENVPVVGVHTVGELTYRDLLRIWARGGRMGREFVTMICDEETFIDLMLLKEIYGIAGGTGSTKINMTVESTIPSAAKSYIHSIIPEDTLLILDPNASLMQLDVEAMSVESERIVQQGINATYVKMRKGFAKMWQDGSVLLNRTIQYNKTAGQTGGFPTWMDPSKIELATFKGRSIM